MHIPKTSTHWLTLEILDRAAKGAGAPVFGAVFQGLLCSYESHYYDKNSKFRWLCCPNDNVKDFKAELAGVRVDMSRRLEDFGSSLSSLLQIFLMMDFIRCFISSSILSAALCSLLLFVHSFW
jgi:hypothetical protein